MSQPNIRSGSSNNAYPNGITILDRGFFNHIALCAPPTWDVSHVGHPFIF
ncbi:hypothetical protein VCRA2121O391_200001 [Vibrio crassostreae]|nr:hypothetical protein VCRA2113O356_220001 [Vibrio crassostreae]CAK1906018.1 hypothetical protein VCRA2117O378_220104 [Vibrio crassostreae]CAK2319193.1 hypothetical protein VCRA2119O386_230001 [Vibrio crassostreae]CAK2672349.1 hypothetical protein VCRA2117O375_200001 [Vibrio crassostreae]CAK2739007.1 hypothetical protein VCRA2121O391_200001 [Vibrio crassostreae]